MESYVIQESAFKERVLVCVPKDVGEQVMAAIRELPNVNWVGPGPLSGATDTEIIVHASQRCDWEDMEEIRLRIDAMLKDMFKRPENEPLSQKLDKNDGGGENGGSEKSL